MRFIVYGVGAVGGVIAGALAARGEDVVGIARGARLDVLRNDGMSLLSPAGKRKVKFDCVGSAREVALAPDDAILLTVKGQDTLPALLDLRSAGMEDQPLFCCQNGVANEATALRYFANVHGVNVMLPCQYMSAGETIAWCSPNYGNFDIGRYPRGLDEADSSLAGALTPAGIGGYPTDRVMVFKYGKLIMNLSNIVEAALGRQPGNDDLADVLQAEGREVLDRAGIRWEDVGDIDPRRELMHPGTVAGFNRLGGSTTQSLARGAGSVETDFLNGEIVLIGRLHGIETPANLFATRLAARLAREGYRPGDVTRDELASGLGL